MPRSYIIGIGSHHGIDQTGWWLCDQLSKLHWTSDIEIQTCSTPAQLPNLINPDTNTILLDFVQTKNPKEQILNLQVEDLLNNSEAGHSIHGFGVAEALRLSYALGLSPSSILILGVYLNENTRSKDEIPQKIIISLQQKIISWINSRNQKDSHQTELNGMLYDTE